MVEQRRAVRAGAPLTAAAENLGFEGFFRAARDQAQVVISDARPAKGELPAHTVLAAPWHREGHFSGIVQGTIAVDGLMGEEAASPAAGMAILDRSANLLAGRLCAESTGLDLPQPGCTSGLVFAADGQIRTAPIDQRSQWLAARALTEKPGWQAAVSLPTFAA